MKIAVGSDHAGYPLKIALLDTLKAKGHEIGRFWLVWTQILWIFLT